MFEVYESFSRLNQKVNELKATKMTLEQFRERFAGELDVIEIRSNVGVLSEEDGKETIYKGPVLAVGYKDKTGPDDFFPFPNADDPNAPAPPDVFDYLASYWRY